MKLDHVGIVVKNIEEFSNNFATYFGFTVKTEAINDPIQNVILKFLEDGNGNIVELIQPFDANSPINRFLDKGGGYYHLCFEVENIEVEITRAVTKGALLVKGPDPAVAFNGREVAFLFFKNIGIVEMVEA